MDLVHYKCCRWHEITDWMVVSKWLSITFNSRSKWYPDKERFQYEKKSMVSTPMVNFCMISQMFIINPRMQRKLSPLVRLLEILNFSRSKNTFSNVVFSIQYFFFLIEIFPLFIFCYIYSWLYFCSDGSALYRLLQL